MYDLDILFSLTKDKVVSFEVYDARILSGSEGIAKIGLKYSNGCLADVFAISVSMEKYRKIRVF
jgi:hypothetical protein